MNLKKMSGIFGIAAFLIGFSASAAEFRSGEIIVKYKNGVQRDRMTMNTFYKMTGVKHVYRFARSMSGMEHLVLNDNVKVEDVLAALKNDPNVEYAQPNYIVRTLPIAKLDEPPGGGFPIPCIPGFEIPGCDPNATLPCLIPGIPFPPGCDGSGGGGGNNPKPGERPPVADAPAETNPPVADPDLSKAYGIAKVGAEEAWKTHRGKKDFVVAVIDTGIDYNHEDLSLNVWRNPKPGPQNDLVGFDFVHNDGLPFDDNKHGTHCSGTVGGVGGNGVGVSGVNQRVSIMGLKFLSAQGSGDIAGAIKAIDYGIEHGVKVMSNSWGGEGNPNDGENKALGDAIERARQKDILFIAAAGNGGFDGVGDDNDKTPNLPAAYPIENVIAVAATDQNDKLASFSNFGKKSVHLGAPGVNVYSTTPGNKYEAFSGTSMACPHVAGAAALLWSQHPEWNYKQVKDALLKNVDPVPALANKTVTGGRLNVLKALRASARR